MAGPKFGRIVPVESRGGSDLTLRGLPVGEHSFRIITGGDIREQIMWPTQAPDENGAMAPTWRSVQCPIGVQTPLDKLAELEREARTRVAQQDGRNGSENLILSRSESRLYEVLYRAHQNPSEPLVLECTSIVLSRSIAELNATRSKVTTQGKDGTEISTPVWRFGPTFLYDVIVKKTSGSGQFSTRYTLQTARNPWYEQCPIADWPNGAPPEDFDFVGEGVFTEEEYENIMSSTIDIEALVQPHNEARMMEMLYQFPINPKAVSKDGRPLFEPRVITALCELLTENNFPLIGEATQIPSGAPRQVQAAPPPTVEPPPPGAAPQGATTLDKETLAAYKKDLFNEVGEISRKHECDYLSALKLVAEEYDVNHSDYGDDDTQIIEAICRKKAQEAQDNGGSGGTPPPAPAPVTTAAEDDLPF